MTEQRDIATAPKDGTRILVWVVPALTHTAPRPGRPSRIVQPAGKHALVRWFGDPAHGHWSSHQTGDTKIKGTLTAWWPLPERSAA